MIRRSALAAALTGVVVASALAAAPASAAPTEDVPVAGSFDFAPYRSAKGARCAAW